MTRVILSDKQSQIRAALRLLLTDLNMQVVGEATNWSTTLAQAFRTQPDMLVVDWELLPTRSSLGELRVMCPTAAVIVLISHLDARQHIVLSVGADAFISKNEILERTANRLLATAGSVHS